VTGSIGVIVIRPNLKGLYQKARVKKDRVLFDKTRDILSESADMSLHSQKLLVKNIEDAYRVFVSRVSDGRGLEAKEILKSAGGQIFTGGQFRERGFVDGHLDFIGALADYREKAGYSAEQEFRVSFYPEVKADVRSIVSSRMPIPGLTGQKTRALELALDHALPAGSALEFFLASQPGRPAVFSAAATLLRA
ncbi:MAG: S49 family peptidase, partial [Spirochaetia bacterium]|nr:S49 family peptidase [Spirochaetia bacterium]